jgi:hypothetical protein
MEDESSVSDMRILVKVVDAIGVEQRTAPLDAMDGIAFAQQKLGQISSVLSGDTGDQSSFCQDNPCESIEVWSLFTSQAYSMGPTAFKA